MRTHKITTILMLLVACIAAGNTYAQTLVDRVAIIVNDESILQSEVQERMQLLESADARNAAHQDIMREALDRMESRLEEVAQNSATKLEDIRRDDQIEFENDSLP